MGFNSGFKGLNLFLFPVAVNVINFLFLLFTAEYYNTLIRQQYNQPSYASCLCRIYAGEPAALNEDLQSSSVSLFRHLTVPRHKSWPLPKSYFSIHPYLKYIVGMAHDTKPLQLKERH